MTTQHLTGRRAYRVHPGVARAAFEAGDTVIVSDHPTHGPLITCHEGMVTHRKGGSMTWEQLAAAVRSWGRRQSFYVLPSLPDVVLAAHDPSVTLNVTGANGRSLDVTVSQAAEDGALDVLLTPAPDRDGEAWTPTGGLLRVGVAWRPGQGPVRLVPQSA